MGREDWYRRKTWTPQDREEFLARLKRSRGACNKAQYARIQAVELLATKKSELVQPALELLDMMLAEWPEETSQIAAAYQSRAECLIALNRIEEAIGDFRKVFEWQRRVPNVRTGAHLDFAWLVVTRRLAMLYGEALAGLDEFGGDEMFPFQGYMIAASRALIAHEQGETEQARSWAKQALEEASKTHTGFPYHPTLCLVEKPPNEQAHRRLQALANGDKPKGLLGFIKSFRN